MTPGVVLILGLDDLATACAIRLYRSGFKIILSAASNKNFLHTTRNFSEAIHSGRKIIDQIEAISLAYAGQYYSDFSPAATSEFCKIILNDKKIPLISVNEIELLETMVDYVVLADREDMYREQLNRLDEKTHIRFSISPDKKQPGYSISLDKIFYGKVLFPFLADQYPDEGNTIAEEKNYSIGAPIEGVFFAEKRLNDLINEKEVIGKINEIPILAPVAGKISGISRSGYFLQQQSVFVEIDESGNVDGRIIPSNNFALAGGVLEALLYDLQLRGVIE